MNKEVKDFFNEIKALLKSRERDINDKISAMNSCRKEFPDADFANHEAHLAGSVQEVCKIGSDIFCAYEKRLESEFKDKVSEYKKESGGTLPKDAFSSSREGVEVHEALYKQMQDSVRLGNVIGDALKRTAEQPTVKPDDVGKVNIVLIDKSGGTKEYKRSTDDQGRIVIEIKELI